MRYQSFYPFSQSQIPNMPQRQGLPQAQRQAPLQAPPQAPPTKGFLSGLFGSKNSSPPPGPASVPNQYRGAPQQMPFGFRNTGMPQAPNQFPGAPSNIPNVEAGAAKPNRMDHYLQTADRFLSTAEQITPMVQRVSPMFQNIPALWKIYQGFKSMPNAAAVNNVASAATTTAAAAATASAVPPTTVPSGASIPSGSGRSVPRIFQPPL